MHHKIILLQTILVTLIVSSFPLIADETVFKELLRERIESSQTDALLIVNKTPVYAQKNLVRFYYDRLFEPVWFSQGHLNSNATELIDNLTQSENEGLLRENLHWSAITKLQSNLQIEAALTDRMVQQVDLELLLSDAFLTYASHLLQGQVNPEKLDSKWETVRRSYDVNTILSEALEANTVQNTLNNLKPRHQGYHQLLKAMTHYRNLAEQGGWNTISGGYKLKQGSHNARVLELKTRLAVTGDYINDSDQPNSLFDDRLHDAVKFFQRRHGLTVDGVVGPATLHDLNVPVSDRVQQILANLERWRWLPADLGLRHIMVNIAGFDLAFVDNNKVILQMPVVVGKKYRETPVFTGNMTYLVVNPTWNVPTSIAGKDKLPKLIKDPGYLQKHNMKLYRGWGAHAEEIDPYTIEWQAIDPEHFPYRIVQQPGPGNALGKIKFMLPNEHDVYLHDTSEPWLFNKTERTFSSGCIRVAKPFVLANYVLENNTRLSPSQIKYLLNQKENKTLSLKKPIPVHILYWTAWADDGGIINFRKDIYNRDKNLLSALAKLAVRPKGIPPKSMVKQL